MRNSETPAMLLTFVKTVPYFQSKSVMNSKHFRLNHEQRSWLEKKCKDKRIMGIRGAVSKAATRRAGSFRRCS